MKFLATPGNRADCTQFEELAKNLKFDAALTDKGYDSNSIVESVINQGEEPIIPPRKNRKIQRFYDKEIYKERHKIENLFGWMKYYRRLFSRFDRLKSRFMGFLHFVGALIWLR